MNGRISMTINVTTMVGADDGQRVVVVEGPVCEHGDTGAYATLATCLLTRS